jgi:hypothetical protein
MIMRRVIIVSIIIFILLGCEKENKPLYTQVSGYVVSTGSGKPVENVKIYMYDGFPYSSHGSSRRDSTVTNSYCYFEIGLSGEEPVIYPYKSGYTFEYEVEGAVIGIMPLNAGSDIKDVFIKLDGIAYFSPVLMNILKQTEEDTVLLFIYSKHNVDYEIMSGIGDGPHKYWSLEKGFDILGDHYQKYKVKYERNDQWNVFVDSVYVKLGEVYRDTIWY